MNTILEKQQLSDEVFLMRIRSPLIAEERKPGQFLILQLDDNFGERIPLTIADANEAEGSITIVFQAVGKTTHRLAALNAGDRIANLVGPLGRPTHIEKFGTVVCVGGGIGVAPLHPIVQGMKKAGNRVIVILGARSKDLVILEPQMRALADEIVICTDDGSYGRKGLVTAPLKEFCERAPKPQMSVAIGPPIMMKACADVTKAAGVPIMVSLNSIMIDGTGMCGGCRVTVGGQTRFTCVDGPEFDGHQVDFDNLMKRLRAYKNQEDAAHEKCHLEMAAGKKAEGRTPNAERPTSK